MMETPPHKLLIANTSLSETSSGKNIDSHVSDEGVIS